MFLKQIISLCFLNYFHYASGAKKIGSSCIGEDNIEGTCVNIYNCPSAVVAYLFYNYGTQISGLPEVCGYDGNEPVVCCTDCFKDVEKNSTGYKLDRFGQLVSIYDGPPAKKMCTRYFQELPYSCQVKKGDTSIAKYKADNGTCHQWTLIGGLAVGGRDANKREFPHMALLGFGENQNAAQWLCGGSIISERYILTAGHCSSAPQIGPVTYAALGILKRTDPIETWQIYKIKNFIAHPAYKAPARYHDIALAEVDKPIQFSQDVLPACLNTIDYNFESAQAVGWGRLGRRSELADNLQVVELLRFKQEKCDELFPQHRHLVNGYDNSTQMCYGNPFRIVDTCEGDSGGPLQIDYYNCQYTVTGVTSYGKDCGLEGGAGMYTRVYHYVPWIEKIVWSPNLFLRVPVVPK